ncbi:MAG: isocitrate/isopropylmalate dehydrogenase family protein [Methanobacteriota archaeon]|nr:MAG: isocitrate/isopropylmalate dehydrogenase family protein [Euryarchaeota archaeon]
MHRVAVIPGDGIGPEVVEQARRVLDVVTERCGVSLDFEEFDLGAAHYLETGEVISDETIGRLEGKDAILLGALGDPRVRPGVLEKGILLRLRFHFDEYVNLRPVTLYDGIPSALAGDSRAVNMRFVRENTEDFYVGLGGRTTQRSSEEELLLKRTAYEAKFDVGIELEGSEELAYQIGVITRGGARRVMDYAFSLARSKGVDLVTSVDKANVLTEMYGLWREEVLAASTKYGIDVEFQYVDAVALHMVRAPARFKLLVTPNLFGDILTDLGAALQGGLGFAPSGNINPEGVSMFEPVHGSAPDIAGLGLANPVGAVLSSALMLDTLGYEEAADAIEQATRAVLGDGKHRTPDTGGTTSTTQMGDAIVARLRETG